MWVLMVQCGSDTIGSYTAVVMYALYVVCVFTKGIIQYILMYLKDGTGLYACGYPSFCLSSHTITHNKQNAHRFILNNQERFQQRRATLCDIYISIHRGLTVFNSTSLRQSFTGCAIHDRLCTECEL